MRATWTIAVAVGLGAGAALAACGGGSGTVGQTSTGHGGAGGHGGASSTSSSGMGGGISLEGGVHDSATYDGDACGSVAIASKITPGNIVVVFDQSDSMSQPYSAGDGGTSGPKWKVSEDAIVAALTPSEAILNVGAIFFPTKATGNTCSLVDPIGTPPQIKIEPGATFVSDFQAHFAAAGWTLILGTPTVDALKAADMALPDPSPLKGERAVVLITDGAPTCDTVQADLVAPVADMFSRKIKTYVVGLPGSVGATNLLDALAVAGGTGPKFLSPADATALQAALAQIATSTIDQCTVTLSPPPADPTKVHLIVTDPAHPQGEEIPQTTDGGAGWTLSPDGMTATLTGAVCTKAKNGGYTTINFVYGCPVLP